MAKREVLNNRWEEQRILKSGGQGVVYLVKDVKTSGMYAAKVFEVKGYDQKKLARAKIELEAIKKLEGDAHVVRIYDENISAAEPGETIRLYYVMDYARHGSLDSNDFYVGDVQQCLRLFKQMLAGVRNAHAKKVVHRDLKPGNILLFPTQREVVINDFGLGLLKDRDPESAAITELGEVLGPRYFMAPEQQLRPSEADERSDIYSLGKILYYMLTGKGKTYREKLDDINEVLSEPNPYIPQIQDRLLGRMVAEKPDDRFSNVSEAIDELDGILDQLDTNSRRYLKPSERSLDVYGLLVANRRDQFIESFKKSLDWPLWALETVIEVLLKDGKSQTFDALKTSLLEKYPTGKANAAIRSTLYFMTDAKELASQQASRYSFPSYYLARYYLESKAISTAHEYIVKALSIEKDSALQLRYLFVFEEVCRKCGCELPHDYDERIKAILKAATGTDAANLLRRLGQHYLNSGDKRKGLRFLETYLSEKPYEDETRWTCAFEYSALGEVSLSLHHYSVYLAHNPRSADVINNLGAAYGDRNLNIAALEKFREAYALGNTLAGANIAAKYMAVGMVDDAKRLLDEIIASHPGGDYHSNVAANLGAIVSARQMEDEIRKKWETESGLLNVQNIQAVRSAIKYSGSDWVGYWELTGECVFECTIDASRNLQIKLVKTDLLAAEFIAVVEEGCLEVRRYKKPYGNEYNFGILYLAGGDTLKGYLQGARDDYKMVEGKRIDDIAAYKEKHDRSLKALLNVPSASA